MIHSQSKSSNNYSPSNSMSLPGENELLSLAVHGRSVKVSTKTATSKSDRFRHEPIDTNVAEVGISSKDDPHKNTLAFETAICLCDCCYS